MEARELPNESGQPMTITTDSFEWIFGVYIFMNELHKGILLNGNFEQDIKLGATCGQYAIKSSLTSCCLSLELLTM